MATLVHAEIIKDPDGRICYRLTTTAEFVALGGPSVGAYVPIGSSHPPLDIDGTAEDVLLALSCLAHRIDRLASSESVQARLF
jgi:hypothetical protein